MGKLLVEDPVIGNQKKTGGLAVQASDGERFSLSNSLK